MPLRSHPVLAHVQPDDIIVKRTGNRRRDFSDLFETVQEAIETAPVGVDPALHIMRCIVARHGGDRVAIPAHTSFKKATRRFIEKRIDDGADDYTIALEVGLTPNTIEITRRLYARANTK